MVIGFPRSKNKDPDRTRQSLDPKIWHYYGTGRIAADMYGRLHLSGEDHVSIKYEQRSRTPDGEWVNTIFARGMSGGPVIDLGAQTPPTDPGSAHFDGRLSGVLIEWDAEENVLLSVKVNLIVDRIRTGVGADARIGPDRIR